MDHIGSLADPHGSRQAGARAIRERRVHAAMTRIAAVVCAAACAGAVAACGSSKAGPETPRASLEIDYLPHGQGGPGAVAWTLACKPSGGDHPQPRRACAELALQRAPFAAPAGLCPLDILRGAPMATVSGVYRGQAVRQTFRPNCGSGWRRLHVVLTGS